jgi:hypothetical protein
MPDGLDAKGHGTCDGTSSPVGQAAFVELIAQHRRNRDGIARECPLAFDGKHHLIVRS